MQNGQDTLAQLLHVRPGTKNLGKGDEGGRGEVHLRDGEGLASSLLLQEPLEDQGLCDCILLPLVHPVLRFYPIFPFSSLT